MNVSNQIAVTDRTILSNLHVADNVTTMRQIFHACVRCPFSN